LAFSTPVTYLRSSANPLRIPRLRPGSTLKVIHPMESDTPSPSHSSTQSREPNRDRGDRGDRGDRERTGSFEQMKVWQEAHALVLRVFEVTPRIPPEQQEGLAAMMEKAAIEVPKSIAEGFKRRGSRNKAHYYNLSQASLESLRYMLILCRDLKYEID